MNNNNLLDVLTRQGVLISVNIRFWRAQKKLTAQDIGIDPDDVTERLISLGHKRLLPKEARQDQIVEILNMNCDRKGNSPARPLPWLDYPEITGQSLCKTCCATVGPRPPV